MDIATHFRHLNNLPRWLQRVWQGERYIPRVGHVHFGDLRRLKPIGFAPDEIHRGWGFDRGGAIDRYYIENFLALHTDDVRGRVLELGDNTYTYRFGGDRVAQSDVLNRLECGGTTIVADLTDAPHIPTESFDCVIFTQTLQLIYDAGAAIRTVHRILKPGGVVLVTVPGITQTYDREWGSSWCWSFTSTSARRLFGEIFSEENVSVEAHGNVLVAIAFLQGLGVEELSRKELDYSDSGYEFLITVRAVKSETGKESPKERL